MTLAFLRRQSSDAAWAASVLKGAALVALGSQLSTGHYWAAALALLAVLGAVRSGDAFRAQTGGALAREQVVTGRAIVGAVAVMPAYKQIPDADEMWETQRRIALEDRATTERFDVTDGILPKPAKWGLVTLLAGDLGLAIFASLFTLA